MSDKIELMRLCGVLQSNFLCLSQSESWTQPCHVRIKLVRHTLITLTRFILTSNNVPLLIPTVMVQYYTLLSQLFYSDVL